MEKGELMTSPFSKLLKVGIVVRDNDKAVERLTSLGIGPFEQQSLPHWVEAPLFRGSSYTAKVNLLSAVLDIMEIELAQPIEGESHQMEFLNSIGEGVDRIALAVDDIEKEVARLTEKGFSVLFSGNWEDGGFAYFDIGIGGMVFELIQGYEKKSAVEKPSVTSPLSKFAHVGIAVRDADKVIERLTSFGIGPFKGIPRSGHTDVTALYRGKISDAEEIAYYAKIGDTNFVIHQPVSGEDCHMEFLNSIGEGLDHIAFWVDDLDKEVARLTEQGISVAFSVRREGFGSNMFDTGIGGAFIEIVQA